MNSRNRTSADFRRDNLRWNFDMSPEDYIALSNKQNGVCAICKKPETALYRGKPRLLAIDHNHSTEEIRGLLCFHCNVAIGHLQDSPELLLAAAQYLNSFK